MIDDAHIEQFINLMVRFHQAGKDTPPFEIAGITPSQVAYIDLLAKKGPCHLTQLTESMALSPASVSVMMRHLQNKGLIERQQDPKDKRSIQLQLSEKGWQVFNNIVIFRKEKVATLLSRLSLAEKQQFLSLFEIILSNPNS